MYGAAGGRTFTWHEINKKTKDDIKCLENYVERQHLRISKRGSFKMPRKQK